MRLSWFVFIAISIFWGAPSLPADSLKLRGGKIIDGTLVGASARQLDFLPASGQTMSVPLDQVASISFSSPSTQSPQAPPKSRAALIPAGTSFRIRTIDPIDVDVAQAGTHYRGTLDDPIMLGGNVIVPRGADVTLVAAKVAQGGRFKGSDLVEMKVDSILVRGKSYPVVTSVTETKSGGEGKKTAGKIVGGAGLGAIIGGIAGGGKGAAIGVLAGGAAGTAVAASGQPHLKIPPETRLQFELMADWKIR
jgi:hypothetical protein